MNERLKFQGHLRTKRLDAKKLEAQLQEDRRMLRYLLDPYKPIAEADFENVFEMAVEARGRHINYVALLKEIDLIKTEQNLD